MKQCTNVYRVYCNIEILTANVDQRLKELHEKIANIANSFDGLTSLTTSIDGQILTLENQVFSFEKERDKIIRRARSLRDLVSPRLDLFGVHKRECMDMLAKPTLAEVTEKETLAYLLSGLVSISETFKTSWDTYVQLLEKAYPEILRLVKLQ